MGRSNVASPLFISVARARPRKRVKKSRRSKEEGRAATGEHEILIWS
jgi:hypothetical protein